MLVCTYVPTYVYICICSLVTITDSTCVSGMQLFYYVIKICNDFVHYVITPWVSMADLPSLAETRIEVRT